MFRVYLGKIGFKLGSAKPEMVRTCPHTRSWGKDFYREDPETKQGN